MATTLKTSTRQPKELISSPAIFRTTSKTGEFLGYGVPSDSQPGVMYQVTWNYTRICWQCNCPATKPCKHIKAVCEVCRERKAQGKTEFCPCEEIKVVAATTKTAPRQQENWDEPTTMVTAKSNDIAAIFVSDAHAAVAPQQATPAATTWVQMPNATQRLPERARWDAEREQRNTAPLNGNQGFSLLRR